MGADFHKANLTGADLIYAFLERVRGLPNNLLP
jgi:uncharacterized protein YjbI with pentapeptide repeats